ncbi:MAG: hypothetical protein Q4E28_04005, partial [Clostridia bacterium]|nr:hypothetical protein [Clostridia bacterium]
MFEKKKNRLLLLGLYIIFNIISLVLFGMVFFTDIEVPITLPIIILITWAIAIGFLYCYKMTGFPTLKSTIVLFYNAITNILLYFMPLIFQYAGILSKNKILFAVPIINFLLSAFLLSYDFIKTYGKDKEVIRDMNFYLEDGKESHSTSMDEYIELSEDDSKYITEQEENTEEEYFEEIQVNEVFDEKLSSEEVSVDEADEEIISEEVPVDEA